MSNQSNQDKSNRAKARRARRQAARVPGKGAGPVPIRAPTGQPAVTSLAELAKSGGQVPLSIPQLMSQVGTLKVERDFWMNAAVSLEAQVQELLGGGTIPSPEDVADAEEEGEIQDISNTVEACPSCNVALSSEAVHAEGCQFQGHEFTEEGEPVTEEEGEPAQIGTNVPAETLPTPLTSEEQAVVDKAKTALQQAEWVDSAEQALQEKAPE